MITDAKETFVPPGNPLSLVAAAGVDIPSPLIVDLLGGGARINALALKVLDKAVRAEADRLDWRTGHACINRGGSR